ncbi:MAG: methyltransferase [Gemmatimonadota bacterium]|nr:methyltransferase [Gemmatimonadota bacterium]
MTAVRGEMASPMAAEWARSRPQTDAATASSASTALVLCDPAPHLALALEESGTTVTRWHRFLSPGQKCTPWPPPGPFDEVWVRMPRSSLEAAMLLHAAAARVGDGSPIHLFGASDEGIRSAARHFPAGTGEVQAALIKRRCRLLVAARVAPPPRGDGLDSWQTQVSIDWGTGPRDWIFYPGVFAHGRLDAATTLLIECLPRVPQGGRILDFGAGTGPLAAAALERAGDGAEVVLLEPDAISLAAAARNVPGGHRVLGGVLTDISGPFDLLVSNPPVHAGKQQSLRTVEALVREAPLVLAHGGELAMVAQRRLPVGDLLDHSFKHVRSAADRGPFRVWRARGTPDPPLEAS